MVLRVVAGQAAREAPGGLPPSGASSFVVYGTCTAYVRCTGNARLYGTGFFRIRTSYLPGGPLGYVPNGCRRYG
jgi:hypothetical protein